MFETHSGPEENQPKPDTAGGRASSDHFIARVHMRQWATGTRVTMLRRGMSKPKLLDVGNAVAAERGLNHPVIEAAYGRIEGRFGRALKRLLDPAATPTDRDWNAVRQYVVLVHDRYPALRGSSTEPNGLLGGNIMMVPNPAHWGSSAAPDSLNQLATAMDRESLKAFRLDMLEIAASLLPRYQQVFYAGPMLLGDAGVHGITLHPDGATARSYVAMPLASDAMVVFGHQAPQDSEVAQIADALRMKTALHSTEVMDTVHAPVIQKLVLGMWKDMPQPVGTGTPRAIHLYNNWADIPR